MNMTIYIIGLLVAIGMLVFNIDDIIWDIGYLLSSERRRKEERIPMAMLDELPPKLLAVMVAAWHEENVIEQVIDHMISSVHYPRSMYHVFLGVYPNDPATIEVAERLSQKYENVHVVVNPKDGPTSKAQNLNHMITIIHDFEREHFCRFAAVTVHDSEDVVHPYELKVTNFLIDQYDSLQFPVFPLQRKPNWKNFFSEITSGTYADEFAENHFRYMVMRSETEAVVPSAGTGFVISRNVLDYYQDKPLFTEGSLTEDYKFSIDLAKHGFQVHYVLEKVPRLLQNGKLKWDYVATRSLFPKTFGAAVKQKTRWIYGITMQSLHISDILSSENKLNFVQRSALYKDWKSKFINILVLPAYVILVYFIVSLFVPSLPAVYPIWSLSWWLSLSMTVIMFYKQFVRGFAIYHVYGFRSVVAACLVPPILPLRLMWGNLINFTATARAWSWYFFGMRSGTSKRGVIKWNKTEHEFLEKHVLYIYYRNLGDVLLEKQYISPDVLKRALEEARVENKRLGEVLLDNGYANEEMLANALAASAHKLFVEDISVFDPKLAGKFGKSSLEENLFYPLMEFNNGCAVAETIFSDPELYLCKLDDTHIIHTVYTTTKQIKDVCEGNVYITPRDREFSDRVRSLVKDGVITWEQAAIALQHRDFGFDVLKYMGVGLTVA